MSILKTVLFFIAINISFNLHASVVIDSLSNELISLREKALKSKEDADRNRFNASFGKLLFDAVQENKSILFDSIPNLAVVYSDDENLRLINWNIVFSNQSFLYGCILSKKVKREWRHYFLNDISEKTDDPESYVGTVRRWYGMLYYDIVSYGKKNSSYLLLAWDGNDQYSNKKIIDVLWFDESDIPRFGRSVFSIPHSEKNRLIFEYSKDAVMSLKYNEKNEWVVFDHLSPIQPNMEGMYEYYVPDLSFDAIQYRKDAWYFIQNVDIRGEQGMENYTAPPPIPFKNK